LVRFSSEFVIQFQTCSGGRLRPAAASRGPRNPTPYGDEPTVSCTPCPCIRLGFAPPRDGFPFHHKLSLVLALGLAASFAGCPDKTVTSTERVSTLAQARTDYLEGLRALEDADYPRATELLQRVARGPSYIVYSPLARLRLADSLFFQEKYEEAVEAYRAFTETSAGDPNLHYAYYMLAESSVRSLPAEFFLVPPADRRDQRRIRVTLGAYKDFLDRFPDSPFVEPASMSLKRMIRIVTSYEMEVARFYMTRDKPAGAVARLQRLAADVPVCLADEDVHVALATALAATKDADALRKECDTYRQRFPAGRRRAEVASACARVPVEAPAGN
jgi:outer membrane protein assembly factor BamD